MNICKLQLLPTYGERGSGNCGQRKFQQVDRCSYGMRQIHDPCVIYQLRAIIHKIGWSRESRFGLVLNLLPHSPTERKFVTRRGMAGSCGLPATTCHPRYSATRRSCIELNVLVPDAANYLTSSAWALHRGYRRRTSIYPEDKIGPLHTRQNVLAHRHDHTPKTGSSDNASEGHLRQMLLRPRQI